MAEDFEKSRQALLDKIEQMRHKAKADEEKAKVVVFGAPSPFVDGLVLTIKKKYGVSFFSDADEACAYCLTYETNVIIIDMDPPTNWKMATDVFTGVRTLRPHVTVIICTKAPLSVPVQTLAAQKADVLVIPFSVDVLFKKIKTGL
jgi:DNA-binding NtrC family response regulator